MSVYAWNAARFASTSEPYIDQERHAAVRNALQLIRKGHKGKALYLLTRSVERQNRIAGGGTVPIAPTCPCGRPCTHPENGAAS